MHSQSLEEKHLQAVQGVRTEAIPSFASTSTGQRIIPKDLPEYLHLRD